MVGYFNQSRLQAGEPRESDLLVTGRKGKKTIEKLEPSRACLSSFGRQTAEKEDEFKKALKKSLYRNVEDNFLQSVS